MHRTAAATWAAPAPATWRPIFPNSVRETSSPTVNSRRTTPISARDSTTAVSATSPAPVGPRIAPATRKEATTERRSRLKR